jgi:hypothetical protein
MSGATIAPPSPPPPATTAPAHLPLWVIVTMIAATVLLSVATTLITLSLTRLRRAHQAPAPEPNPHSAAMSALTPEPRAAKDDGPTENPRVSAMI